MLVTYLSAIGVGDVLDMGMLSALIYALLLWVRESRAAFVARGMIVTAGIYLLARVAGMVMVTTLFHALFAILAVALVVIFQEELRQLFERIAVWSLSHGKILSLGQEAPQAGICDLVARTAFELAETRTGAIIVLAGRDPLDRHLEGGWPLHGHISGPLLKSLFDPHSIGHDGAAIVKDSSLARFGCRLPLSRGQEVTIEVGTRHMAAMGLSELCDALCIVVSEERGVVSLAQAGKLEQVEDEGRLRARVAEFGDAVRPRSPRERLRGMGRRNWQQKLFATLASVMLWVVFVFAAKDVEHAFQVPVVVTRPAPGLEVASVRPEVVSVRLAATIGDFFWEGADHLSVRLDLMGAPPGVSHVGIGTPSVFCPVRFRVLSIEPAAVDVELTPSP